MSVSRALVTLAHIVEPGDPQVAALVDRVGAEQAVEVIAAGRAPMRHARALQARWQELDLESACQRAAALGVQIVHRGHDRWPMRLDDLGPTRPYAIWVRGSAPVASVLDSAIAMVGTRDASPYGQAVARAWAAGLVEQGWTIVSGAALGIDGVAHRAVLDVGGCTVAVLACGVDVSYPSAHGPLLERIARNGLVLSESPLGEGVRRQRFLTRNRLIAALTKATVVVEAGYRSGTTSTAHAAARLARLVFAVPGPVTAPTSAGCHRLINDQVAMLAASLEDVVEMVGPLGTSAHTPEPSPPRDALSELQVLVLDAFPARGTIGFDGLLTSAGLAIDDIASAVGALQRLGFIVPAKDGWRLSGRG